MSGGLNGLVAPGGGHRIIPLVVLASCRVVFAAAEHAALL